MSRFTTAIAAAGIVAAAAVTISNSSDAQRADGQSRATEALETAIQALNDERYDDATRALASLDSAKLSPFEQSRAEQILFSVAYAQERLDEAREHLQRAIAAGGLSAQEIAQARYQRAQLLMAEERWLEGEAALEEWLAANPQHNPAAEYLLAVARYQANDFDGALAPARAAVDSMTQPQENWLSLLLALHLQSERYLDAIPLLQQLVVLVPAKKSYWLQRSSVYGQIEDYANSSAIMQLAYNAGLLTEDGELRRLADLLLFNKQPQRAATVLEEAIEKGSVTLDDKLYEKLANAWIEARELDKAIAPLERAAELATTGRLFVRLGEVHVERQDWTAAEIALGRGVAKDGLDDLGAAQFLMGVVLFEQGRFTEARPWFAPAREARAHRETADAYIREIARRSRRL